MADKKCNCKEPSPGREIVLEVQDRRNPGMMAQFRRCSNKGCGGLVSAGSRRKTDAERDPDKQNKRRFGKKW